MAGNITISDEAVAFLKSLKSKGKSYSDVVLEFQSARGSPERVLRTVGEGKGDPNEKERDGRRRAFRRDVEARFRRRNK